MTPTLLIGWLLAFVFGARHASEPDHIAAMTTLVAEHTRPRRAIAVGALWGVGHAATLLVTGALLVTLHLRLSARASDLFELAVAAMLLVLGGRSIHRAARLARSGPTIAHHHGPHAHTHAAGAKHVHLGPWTLARRPLAIGAVHGFAGSGALTTVVLARMPTFGAAIVYMALFGAGSVLGMALLTGAAGVPLRALARSTRGQAAVASIAGLFSLGLGAAWAVPIVARLAA